MDEYHAETIIELIEKVIPKLSRNRVEDMSNGLDINLKKIKNKKYIVQKEPPKQFYSFRGSKVSKFVKTEIEDEQIKNIETNSNVQLHSQPAEGEIIFGNGRRQFAIDIEIEAKNSATKSKAFLDDVIGALGNRGF